MFKRLTALALAAILLLGGLALHAGAETLRIKYLDEGPEVTTIQLRLRELNYYKDDVDGVYGYATVQAVRAFQKLNSLYVDGIVGPDTMSRLNSAAAVANPAVGLPVIKVQFGDYGSQVLTIQTRLQALNYYLGALDGKFGMGTHLAVYEFQKNNALYADGIVGNSTHERLFGTSAIGKSGTDSAAGGSMLRLKYGDSGADVLAAQVRLKELGYFGGVTDGKYGYYTFVRVRQFQQNNKLVADGVIGVQTWAKLFSSTAVPAGGIPVVPDPGPNILRIQYGDKGTQVGELQARLAALGYESGSIDGTFGYATYLAVRAFQHRNALTVDGVVGPKTMEELMSASAVPAVDPAPDPTPEPAKTRWQYGDTGAMVEQIQTELKQLGHYAGEVDGKFGYATYLAVRAYQHKQGLKVDGVVGPLTWAALFPA